MPRAGLLLLPLLLCFGPETIGSIKPVTLKKIVDYVNQYGVNKQYSFAVSLGKDYCKDGSGLRQMLPTDDLQAMQKAINRAGGLYDKANKHIVAAAVNYLNETAREHSEWRLLHSDQNRMSPVQMLLNQTHKNMSCLIFFTLNSPCVKTCLEKKNTYNILQLVNDTFHPIDNDYKAFVFQKIYEKDQGLDSKILLEAWHRLPNVPLFRCDNNNCRNCSENDPKTNTNACLDRR
ncbi:hypothetical protein G0U57_000303 [Chelydra serpentina]|uniref:Uncharacterized protein n=1 Tax=Chelydra serpentina TaxID=8475 RepID=A0A8T1S2N5_CHESE|nr:hypothetical protein G0U57_000303 [Chelydra serpentina]